MGGAFGVVALQMQKEFSREAEQFWGSETGWNDASDAFRYAYVSAIFSQYAEEHTANILGLAYEATSGAGVDSRDNAMDIWNNKVGAEIGKRYNFSGAKTK